jgi:hypothetical protein
MVSEDPLEAAKVEPAAVMVVVVDVDVEADEGTGDTLPWGEGVD